MRKLIMLTIGFSLSAITPAITQSTTSSLWVSSNDQDLGIFGKAFDLLKKRLPPSDQLTMQAIEDELNQMSYDKLYQLKSSPDLCVSTLIDCRGLSTAVVMKALDIALDRRKTIDSIADANRNFYLSAGAGGISFASLIISIIALRRKTVE